MNVNPSPERFKLNSYPFTVEIQSRFGDMDSLNHINNVATARFFEEARVRFSMRLRERSILLDLHQETRIVTAEVAMRYLREIFYPEPVVVALAVLRVGNSSYQVGCGMFQHGHCVALSDAVLVRSEKNGPTPLPDELKQIMAEYQIKAA